MKKSKVEFRNEIQVALEVLKKLTTKSQCKKQVEITTNLKFRYNYKKLEIKISENVEKSKKKTTKWQKTAERVRKWQKINKIRSKKILSQIYRSRFQSTQPTVKSITGKSICNSSCNYR